MFLNEGDLNVLSIAMLRHRIKVFSQSITTWLSRADSKNYTRYGIFDHIDQISML